MPVRIRLPAVAHVHGVRKGWICHVCYGDFGILPCDPVQPGDGSLVIGKHPGIGGQGAGEHIQYTLLGGDPFRKVEGVLACHSLHTGVPHSIGG